MEWKRWKLFRELDSSLTSLCKVLKIIDSPKVGFIVLHNDDVYAVTDTADNFQCLGNGHNFEGADVYQATKVDALCGKGTKDFYGNEFSFEALTEDGHVYSWAPDPFSYFSGDGIPRKILFPDAAQVHQVSSSADHTLCLTSEGKVFGWGRGDNFSTQLGSASIEGYECDVTKVCGIDGHITQVAAGKEASFALDSLGRVWSWGFGRLYYEASGHRHRRQTPAVVEDLPKIKKIVVGVSHVLALSEVGDLYFWGNFLNRSVALVPLRIRIGQNDWGPVIDIASTVEANYAACQTMNKVYMWGLWSQQSISQPRATGFSSLDEVFACADPPVMLQAVRVKYQPQNVVAVAWKRAFNDESTADIRFSVENEVLYAHSAFLKFRSDYFRSMFDHEWEESKKESRAIEIQGFTFGVFKAFMYFLYHGSLIEGEMSVDELTELMKAADYYGDEDLRLSCEKKLKTKLTPQNACFVYACAVKSNAQNLQNYAVEFIIPVFKEVVNSEECIKMDSELKSKLMIHIADLDVIQVPKKRRIQ